MYNEDQPCFVNAAPHSHTARRRLALRPDSASKRPSGASEERNGPRTLDVDLLGLGDVRVVSPHLTLPHPRMFERAFVLTLLADIAAD